MRYPIWGVRVGEVRAEGFYPVMARVWVFLSGKMVEYLMVIT